MWEFRLTMGLQLKEHCNVSNSYQINYYRKADVLVNEYFSHRNKTGYKN